MSGAMPLIRAPVAGDHGHVITRHAVLYQQEQGWDGERFERAVVSVMNAFLQGFEPDRDRAWIADWEHRVAGSIYIMHTDQPAVARLRMLYLEPWARGCGLGHRLLTEALRFSADAGYHRVDLWTVSALATARRLYERAGFTLTSEAPHTGFGVPLTGQIWSLELRAGG